MASLQYISDDKGNRQAVILPIAEYEQMQEQIEELEAIREYDAAKAFNPSFKPLDVVMEDVEKYRSKGSK